MDTIETKLLEYGIYEVTNALGSQIYLIVDTEYTALMETGMAYSAPGLIQNIKKILKDRPLDYIFLTHSHYDHASGIPALKKAWPNIKVYAGEYAKHVFGSDKAKLLMRELNEVAARMYAVNEQLSFEEGLMTVDHVLKEGDRISLGDHVLTAFEVPGHTRCSMCFMLDDLFLFASETTGVVTPDGIVSERNPYGWSFHPSFLISYHKSMEAVEKCRALPARFIMVPHSFVIDLKDQPLYWDFCAERMTYCRDWILARHARGLSQEEITKEGVPVFQDEHAKRNQPQEAFLINFRSIVKTVIREFVEE